MEELIIIGSGPAALTAAIYTARADLKPLMIEGITPGGQLMLTTEVENFPGFPEGVQGPELIKRMKDQATKFGTHFLSDNVIEVDFSKAPFKVKTSDNEFEAKAVIIAVGAEARWLGLPEEDGYKGKGVSVCATCDGFFYKDKEVIVVGGGDAAMEEAIQLTRFANKVYIVARGSEGNLKASKIMQNEVKENEKIEIIYNSEVVKYVGDGKIEGVRLKNNETGEEKEMPINGVFLAIGRKPSTDMFKGQIELDERGYIKTECDRTKTNVPGVFACGDCVDWLYRQASTSAGDGTRASLDAEWYLSGRDK